MFGAGIKLICTSYTCHFFQPSFLQPHFLSHILRYSHTQKYTDMYHFNLDGALHFIYITSDGMRSGSEGPRKTFKHKPEASQIWQDKSATE